MVEGGGSVVWWREEDQHLIAMRMRQLTDSYAATVIGKDHSLVWFGHSGNHPTKV